MCVCMVGADVVRAPRTHSTLMALSFMLIVKYTHCHRKRGGRVTLITIETVSRAAAGVKISDTPNVFP